MPSISKPRWQMSGLLWAILGCCLLLPTSADAQWKWRDSRGQIHISDMPPPRDIPDRDVLQRADLPARTAQSPAAVAVAAGASAPAAAAKAPVDPELEARKRKAEQEQVARQKADEKKQQAARQENCQRAREQLATMESGMRVMRVKPDGEREYMSDEQRASEAQRARGIISSDCR